MPFPDPGVTPPTLNPYEFNFGGFTFGGLTGNYTLISAAGLDQAAIRGGDAGRPRDQGEFVGLNLLGGRDVTVDLSVVPDVGTLWDAMKQLEAAVTPQTVAETPLYFQPPSGPLKVCMARNTKYNWPINQLMVLAGAATAALQFHATDPRWYDAPTTATGPVASGDTVSLDNAGTYPMNPILTVSGACQAPTIANETGVGWDLQFQNPALPDFDLLAGDTLTVNLDLHQVLYFQSSSGNTFSVPNWIAPGSVWGDLAPGASTIGYFTDADDGSSLSIAWGNAYLTA